MMYKTLNIAHRGFTKVSPDNTLESFYAAIKLGVDGIECDVHETADHHFIIFHDNELAGRNLGELPLSEIRNARIHEHYQIPTLEETLELCHNRIKAMLELKLVNSLDLFLEIVNAVMKPGELFITSFNVNLVNKLADFAPQIPRGILTGFAIGDPLALMAATRTRIMLPRFSYVNTELVNTMHNHDFSIMVWDCNSISDLRQALDWGLEGIITDSSDILAKELANRKNSKNK
jgi:glycerophosphoryl diester phosphodiesterase